MSSAWHHFYEFWVGQQTVPGNILGDVLIGLATLMIGKYKIAPWLHARHQEHLEQKERHHQEEMKAHHDLFALHERQYQQLLDAQPGVDATVTVAQAAAEATESAAHATASAAEATESAAEATASAAEAIASASGRSGPSHAAPAEPAEPEA